MTLNGTDTEAQAAQPQAQAWPQAEMPRPQLPGSGAPSGSPSYGSAWAGLRGGGASNGAPLAGGSMAGAPMTGAMAPQAGQPSVTVASYHDYAQAQRAVDFLSDQGFPVQTSSIVGTGLRTVEQVTGRMTTGRAALSGAGAGAWLGLLIGLLLGLFAVGGWLAVVITAVLIGAVWGAIFGAVAHASMRGQRDFSSRSQLQASEYAVNVAAPYADQARELLGRLNRDRATVGS